MKKILIGLAAALLVLSACSKKANHQIKVVEALEKFESKDSFLLYVGSKECAACKVFSPIFEEVAKEYPEYLFYIEYLDAMANQKEDFNKLEDNYIGLLAVTPSIYYVINGEVVDVHHGVLKYSDLEHILNVYEIMK